MRLPPSSSYCGCTALKVLVTSRTVLHRYGEQEFPGAAVCSPGFWESVRPGVTGSYEAIGLFVERAVAVKPDFVLTPLNAPSVAAITIRLDGLPLAIESRQAESMSCSAAIVERLQRTPRSWSHVSRMRRRGNGRCAERSNGATGCSRSTSACCSRSYRCSRAEQPLSPLSQFALR